MFIKRCYKMVYMWIWVIYVWMSEDLGDIGLTILMDIGLFLPHLYEMNEVISLKLGVTFPLSLYLRRK